MPVKNICEYGCGKEAKYQLKNGKWCCEKKQQKCEQLIKNIKNYMKGRKKEPNIIDVSKDEYVCSYCGGKANFKLGNGKFCCNNSYNKCPSSIEKQRKSNIGKKREKGKEVITDKLCDYGCGKKALYQLKNLKYCCNNIQTKCSNISIYVSNSNRNKKKSVEHRNNISKALKGKIRSDEHSQNISQSLKGRKIPKYIIEKVRFINKISIDQINERYHLFSKIEELRYNPDKPIEEKEIQVHCKNHNCPNSKEKGGWFTPRRSQLSVRIHSIENIGMDHAYFYCCEECKNICPLYRLKNDPFLKKEKYYTTEEYQIFKQEVLKRDNDICQYCGEKAEHVHHTKPQKLEPFFSLDPDYAISVCKDCHYKYGHQDECSTGILSNIKCTKMERNNDFG